MMYKDDNKGDNRKVEISCTWNKESNCMNCSIKGELDCKWEQNLLLRFYKYTLPMVIVGILGLILVGLKVSWVPLIIYVAFWIFFFGFFEIRLLCSHCPYYAEGEGRTLHCLANHGSYKFWKYNPEPMKLWEKLGFLSGFLIFALFPIIGEFYGIISLWESLGSINNYLAILIFLLLSSIISTVFFVVKLQTRVCMKCVNFSCPLNKVPKKIVDEYLHTNPVMREAWEKVGYKID